MALNALTKMICPQSHGQSVSGELIGESFEMQRLYRVIEKVSQHTYPVLIRGESGTGKELVARAIHSLGPRALSRFATVDCAALTPTLIESELFGHIKGSFTGATHTKQGFFEAANEGTIFLDEIGDLPVHLQAKLLRVIQEREIRPIGSTAQIPINVRAVAATNRDLEVAIRSGTFRQDLYFRLNVVQIELPPLRQRKSDILLLANHFLEKFSDPQRPTRSISEDAKRQLLVYDWPGNVRELENAVQRAVALSSDTVLQVGDLPPNFQSGAAHPVPGNNELVPLKEIERRAIFRALRETRGNMVAAARLLGIGKTTLYRKLERYTRDLTIPSLSASEEVFCVAPSFLICMNAQCRYLFDFREKSGGHDHVRSCQKCGRLMTPQCPFCLHLLDVAWRQEVPHCSHCGRELRAEAG